MKEKSIIFRGDGVSAILEDRKTQTRKVIKPRPNHFHTFEPGILLPQIDDREIKCPYEPGMKLWVREAWAPGNCDNAHPEKGDSVIYRTDYCGEALDYPWRPSIFMPRWASRITLEIERIRVERLQDISEADAFAEGISGGDWLGDPVGEFKKLWDSINEKWGFGWDTNCWVWILEFKRIASLSNS